MVIVKARPISEPFLNPIKAASRREAVLQAVEGFDITTSTGWQSLDELSSRTELEGVEPSGQGIFETPDGHRFQAIGTVYVTLNYGGKGDGLSMGDGFPFHAYGHFDDDDKAVIEEMEVNTTSFYD